MDDKISFEEFRKKGREKVGLGEEAEMRQRRKDIVEKMKKEIVSRVNKSTADEEMKQKILGATRKLMDNDSD
jgi:hypothetical protein